MTVEELINRLSLFPKDDPVSLTIDLPSFDQPLSALVSGVAYSPAQGVVLRNEFTSNE